MFSKEQNVKPVRYLNTCIGNLLYFSNISNSCFLIGCIIVKEGQKKLDLQGEGKNNGLVKVSIHELSLHEFLMQSYLKHSLN